MGNPKNQYVSKDVVVVKAGEEGTEEAADLGYDADSVERIRDFTAFIIDSAMHHGLNPAETTNALVSGLAYMLTHQVKAENKQQMVSALIEAICVLGGGVTGGGVKQ